MTRGRIDDPFTLSEAFASEQIMAGHRVHVLDGTYSGQFSAGIAGEPGKPIRVKAVHDLQAVIDGDLLIPALGGHITFQDILFTDTGNTDRVSVLPDPMPTDISKIACAVNGQGPETSYINCHLTNGWSGLFSAVQSTGETYGCLIYHNGFRGPQNSFGHGLYVINGSGQVKRLVDNILFDQYGYNIHAYSSAQALDDLWLEGNICFHAGVYATTTAFNIHIGGERLTRNPVLLNNYTYGKGNRLNYSGGITNAVLRNNYFASYGAEVLELPDAFIGDMRGNTFIGTVDGFNPRDWPDNTYITTPDGIQIFVRPNQHAPGRVHVAIYNWEQVNSVQVDVSAHYPNGTPVRARNVQDYFEDVQTVTVTTGVIELDMQARNRSVAKPVGEAEPCATTFPTFGCFVVERV